MADEYIGLQDLLSLISRCEGEPNVTKLSVERSKKKQVQNERTKTNNRAKRAHTIS